VEITRLLRAWSDGDEDAFGHLATAVYAELSRIAHGYMRQERPDQTMQATALVHEAYLRLIGLQDVGWESRAHFFAVSAQMMRRILVDHARSRVSAKRGGAAERVPLETVAEMPDLASWRPSELMTLDDALTRMAEMDPRKAKVIELKFFGGLSVEEIADVLKISPQSVMRDWRLAKVWLQRELNKSG
jgi:RNA polymerase sigma factor (TIGR02999 family)